MDKKQLARRVADMVETLPPMPGNLEKFLGTAMSGQQNRRELARLIRQDPALCVELLHLVNSGCYTVREPVGTIEEAIGAMGAEPLAELMAVTYAHGYIDSRFSGMDHLQAFLTHSHEISLTTGILAEKAGCDPATCNLYTVAGLIHDIGRLIMMVAANGDSRSLMGTSPERMSQITDDEKEILGLDHCEVGVHVCRRWKFLPLLNEGVLRHHTPVKNNDCSVPGAIIFLSHFVSMSDMTGDILATLVPPDVLTQLNLSVSDLLQAQETYFNLK